MVEYVDKKWYVAAGNVKVGKLSGPAVKDLVAYTDRDAEEVYPFWRSSRVTYTMAESVLALCPDYIFSLTAVWYVFLGSLSPGAL